jgi:hypothetical protein
MGYNRVDCTSFSLFPYLVSYIITREKEERARKGREKGRGKKEQKESEKRRGWSI